MTTLYRGVHRTQYDGSALANQNCTPMSGGNGARVATGGKVDWSGARVRSLVARSEETSPNTPGWSLADLRLAMQRLSVKTDIAIPFVIGHGGWSGVVAALGKRYPVVVQGDSEEFPNGTCSGVFNGDHAVLLHADDLAGTLRLLADPICKYTRVETDAILQRYASNFRATISYGVFMAPTPILKPPPAVGALGWARVVGAFWQYTVRGTVATEYEATTRVQKVTQRGYSAPVHGIIEAHWGDRDRKWGKLAAPSAYAGTWVDLLDGPNVRYIES